MTYQGEIAVEQRQLLDAFAWLGQVLVNFAIAEQALGELSTAAHLPITNGSLSSLKILRERLHATPARKFMALERRIDRWCRNRPIRHLLAHATVTILFDQSGQEIVVTRHLPRDVDDVTRDKVWTALERSEILRQTNNDGRSIRDHVNGLLADRLLLSKLRA